MREVLRRWVADADTRQNIGAFGLRSRVDRLIYLDDRGTDLYLSLVGELFDLLRQTSDSLSPAAGEQGDWAALGNALAQFGATLGEPARSDALFFAAAAFYNGGYSASAYLTMRSSSPRGWTTEAYRACYDFLARPPEVVSRRVDDLLAAVREGRRDVIDRAVYSAEQAARDALPRGPELWVAERLYASLVARFGRVNLRTALPAGDTQRWDRLVGSFLDRSPPVWDFFPSQIKAIDAGLLTSNETFSLQMPTGAGKTALTETLMFSHLTARPDDVAVLLVPYRALARELRNSLARRLGAVGLPSRTVYGGTVPSREESQELDTIRSIIGTPEALTGLLSRSPELLSRISLVICDEGHLLDEGARGIGLELLLARLRGRDGSRPRVVFVSAIVPNIEEINVWLGGSSQTVVRSDFRPAEAEYAVLRPTGYGRRMTVGLEMQAVSTSLVAHTLPDFLQVLDFEYTNPTTRRTNTYGYASVKTQAIATARKSLALGTVAVFAATKTGDQGVVGLAGELLKQLDTGLPLPEPAEHVSAPGEVSGVGDYLRREYGAEWIGTKSLLSGVVVHHGDIPQETREALEELLTRRRVRMVLCTSTLAEGVNLPIRTLILYAVRRRSATGPPIPMLARDIRNLVGRAGRAGSSTKGLVICANPNQWADVRPVAAGEPGEEVHGALRQLLGTLQNALQRNGLRLTNTILEVTPRLYPLVDGIDTTLIELLHDELGDEQFRGLASSLAAGTFASQQIDRESQRVLTEVFTLRANHIAELRARGRLAWVRDTGTRARLLDSVINDLAPSLSDWETIESPLDQRLLDAVLAWAYRQGDFELDLHEAYRTPESSPPLAELRRLVQLWIAGHTFAEIAEDLNYDIDTLLRIHGRVVAHALVTLVEQGAALLERYLADSGRRLADAVVNLPMYLRFGVATPAARTMMASGMRHRRAAVALGHHPSMTSTENLFQDPYEIARDLLHDEEPWREALGAFVYARTLRDVAANDDAST